MLPRTLSRRKTIANLNAKHGTHQTPPQKNNDDTPCGIVRKTISTLWRSPEQTKEIFTALKAFVDMLEEMKDAETVHDVMVSLMECQGFRVLERTMSKHIKIAEIVLFGARAMVSLLSAACDDRAVFASELTYIFGGDLLVRVMKYHAEDVEVMSAWCDFAVIILTEQKIIAVQLIRQGLSKVVTDAMEQAPYSEKMQASACQVLPFLVSAADEAMRARLMQIVYTALTIHSHSASVQKCGWEVLSVVNYGTGKSDWEILESLGRTEAMRLCALSLQRHHDDEDLVKRVRLVLMDWMEAALTSEVDDFRMCLELGQVAAAGGLVSYSDRAYARAQKLMDKSNKMFQLALNSSRSWSCAATGRHDLALQYAALCTESHQTWATGWFRKGCAFDGLGKPEEAVECLTRALELAKEPEVADEVQTALFTALEKMAAKWEATAQLQGEPPVKEEESDSTSACSIAVQNTLDNGTESAQVRNAFGNLSFTGSFN